MPSSVLVDSSVWIDHFHGRVTPAVGRLAELATTREAIVADLVLMEVLRGVRQEERLARIRRAMMAYEQRDIAARAVVLRSADFYRDLRGRGITIRSTIDCLIATYCIETGTALLHSDKDFDPFEEHLGLRVVRT